jgi:Cu+-exporting ATPase
MALEKNPLTKRSEPECCGDGGDEEVRDLWWRVGWSAAMTLPVVLLSMGMDLPVIRDIPHDASGWMQFVWSTPVVFWVGWPLLVRFGRSLLTLRFNMFTLIGLGVLAAWLYSLGALIVPGWLPHEATHGGMTLYFESAAVITVLVLIGQLLELRARSATGSAIRALMNLAPKTALLVRDGQEIETAVDDIQIGDVLRIKPGARIPVDGIVMEGSSAVDESMLTGESMPQTKESNAAVTGGTVNGTGTFLMRAERVGANTLLSQIVEMTAKAQASRAPVQRLTDRVSAWFVPAVVLIAVAAFALWTLAGQFSSGLLAFIAVLVISCPCALGIATPAALMVGVGKGAELGILIRSGEVLERVEKLTTVVFDKTGTLTLGQPMLTDLAPLASLSEQEVLQLAGSLEHGSEHPLAAAIAEAVAARHLELLPLEQFEAQVGEGITARESGSVIWFGNRSLASRFLPRLPDPVESQLAGFEAQGKTAMLLGRADQILGVIAVADTVRPEARQAVALLRRRGVRVIMLSGDNRTTAESMAKLVGIEEVIAEVRPADKAGTIKALQQAGQVVSMVGDGVNDAPALVTADIGIAIGSGSDVAKEAGDIILIRNDVRLVVSAIGLSRATMRKIRQNLFWAFIYNGIGIPIAALGWLNPMIAGAAMALSSLSVILNSSLLRRYRAI